MGKRKVTNEKRGRIRSKKKTQQQQQQQQQQQDKTQQHIPRYFSAAKPKPKTKPKRKDHPNKAAATRVQQRQTTLTGHIVPKPNQRAGDQFKLTKPPKHVRITSSNYNNLPAEAYKQKGKQHLIALEHYNIDIDMGQEPGLNFAMLDAYDSLEERVTSLKDGKVTTAHNVWEGKIGKYLPHSLEEQ